MKGFFNKNADYFYFAFRVIIGAVFFLHGWAKIGGVMSGSTSLFSLMGLAMVIELVGGAMLVLGLFTRTAAGISAIEMLYAFIFVHVIGNGTIFPFGAEGNGGEPALLFFAAFLVLLVQGARIWAIDHKISRNK